MKAAPHTDYKALYTQSLGRIGEQQNTIELLQQDVTRCVQEQQRLKQAMASMQKVLMEKEQQIEEQQVLTASHEHTIHSQAAKIEQQQALITAQSWQIADQQQELDKSRKEILRLDKLQYELITLKKWLYGIKSEKRYHTTDQGVPTTGEQLSLPLEVDSWGICKVSDRRRIPAHLRVIKSVTPKKRGGRDDFPEGLEEEITIMEPADKPAGAKCVGHVDQRQLACDPMRWYIKVNRRLVYLVPKDEDHLNYKQLIAPLPAHPIEKCKVDISVLVMLTIEKFVYHMPVWRQQQRLQQQGIHLAYSTLCHLVNETCVALEPLWRLLLKQITASGLISMDETRYRVLDNTKKQGKKSHIGWMWACLNPVQGIVCFLYQKGRGKKDIRSVLQEYKGFLMTDAYGVYTQYGKQPGVTHQHCLSHARRYFVYALNNDAARAGYALDHFFGPLYDIEAECKLSALDYDGITVKRQTESLPVLEALLEWLRAELPKTIPRTPIHKAISYTLNNYTALVKYTTDGMLPIDNNELEGQIRRIALGRHNHLFAGSHRGGELAAIIYSFVATCKLQKIDAAKWLDDVLRRIGDQPEDKLMELLPQFWKPLHQKNVQSG